MKLPTFILSLLISIGVFAQKFENLALTPPMGWNSWNYFECDNLNEQMVKEMADAMVANGMQAAGYEYVIIDDCWQIGRDDNGKIVVDSVKFPHGIKHLSDYIHSKGLKFGIYSDAGTKTCAGRPGSKGYEQIDADTYAQWEVDYLKYDWCHTEGQDAIESYTLMRDALYKAGRPVVFSICDWGTSDTWEWAGEVGHLWRTTYDITDRWDGNIWGNQLGWVEILEKQVGLEKYAAPGKWNDPDMLEVGNPGLSVNESKAHFTMWCMLAAPLITGNDLRNMPKKIRAILTNKNLIAVNQDKLGKQGFKIFDEGNFEIWQKPLENGDIAIVFLNLDIKPKRIVVDWDKLGIYNFSGQYTVKDLWKDKIIGKTEKKTTFKIPKRNLVAVRLIKN